MQDVVPDDMREAGTEQIKLFKRRARVSITMDDAIRAAFRDCREGENSGFLGIDLKIDR